ncbi:hypothetical protein D187_005657 [Cystobacter fuscus DSM 2262]|uniref:Sigma-54-dependent Fis family transcriptional regulator n=1 Tax=Cystobacter fuscus (strain ATCC 25194 / DSM 2262 / NBRC 100088 / M29) TaxID=1242864 RepID=S9PLA3_CYSF2|nr:sigma-54 dependent transcriptional regulator [Cystobacter fuscus]EPX63252.1 hypothetical protein D187_005657 [Cystobacter fuscus DSM 2262]
MNEQQPLRVLLVDDERIALKSFANLLESLGNAVPYRASSLEEARQILEEVLIDIAFIDLQLSQDIRNRDGLTLIQELRERYQTVPIVVSGHSQVHEVREAMKLGAEDYVLKTELEQRVSIILNALRRKLELKEELLDLRARGPADTTLGLVGTSVSIQNLRALIQRVATANSQELFPVLIHGPTGSGKELVAQAIHKLGPHPSDPFFDVNCGALAETLIEDQLFGHVRGAFTDAHTDKEGYFTLVRRGTLFLDEVAELSLSLQAKLLRVLETRRFRPVGPTAREQLFQGRIVAATHVDLKERVREKRFREDLFHRLNVLRILVPPLSDHREDIPALVQHFAARQHRPMQFTQRAIEQLSRRPWPGNVRELRNAITRLAILAESESIDVDTLELYLPLESEFSLGGALSDELGQMVRKLLALPVKDRLDAITKAIVLAAVEQARGNNTEAGKVLGRSRKFVERYLKKLAKGGKDSPSEEEDEEDS